MNSALCRSRGQDIRDRADAFKNWLSKALTAHTVSITSWRRLHGGALQRHHDLEIVIDGGPWAGQRRWVLRHHGHSKIPLGLPRGDEFAVMQALRQAGLTCPMPIAYCDDPAVIGCSFIVLEHFDGDADGQCLVEATARSRSGELLVEQLGRELAVIHGLRPVPLPETQISDPIEARLGFLRHWFDRLGSADPVIEFALRWLGENLPSSQPASLLHGDFRTGNFLVTDDVLQSVLDFEFADRGDPREDIAWLTMRYWRFGADHNLVGGLGSLDSFYRGYAGAGGLCPAPRELVYFQVLANLRWALVASMQWRRLVDHGEAELDLALTGHVRPHISAEILRLIEEGTL